MNFKTLSLLALVLAFAVVRAEEENSNALSDEHNFDTDEYNFDDGFEDEFEDDFEDEDADEGEGQE